jgi:hypothetical protein
MVLPSTLSSLGHRQAVELCVASHVLAMPRVVTALRARAACAPRHSSRASGTLGHQRLRGWAGLGRAGTLSLGPQRAHMNSSISPFTLGFQIEFQFKFILGLNLFKFYSNLEIG